jgi:hypothetical protein
MAWSKRLQYFVKLISKDSISEHADIALCFKYHRLDYTYTGDGYFFICSVMIVFSAQVAEGGGSRRPPPQYPPLPLELHCSPPPPSRTRSKKLPVLSHIAPLPLSLNLIHGFQKSFCRVRKQKQLISDLSGFLQKR